MNVRGVVPHRIERGKLILSVAIALLLCAPSLARPQTPPLSPTTPNLQAIEVNESDGQILSFRHLSGSTVVHMRGTRIEPNASIRMKVGSRPGFTELDINRGEVRGLEPARRFGRDFLTYVLWAVSVDGEASNLGEITFDATGPLSINVTTPYQTFWLMVTAEPDYAVNDPSPVVVLYSVNQNGVETSNKALPIAGKLLYYTYYGRYDTSPAAVVAGIPNEVLQARKAVELAGTSGILAVPTAADQEPLPDEPRTRHTLEQAKQYLQQADAALHDGQTREAVQFARTAAQIAENARALALGAVGGLHVRQLERELEKWRSETEKLRADAEKWRASGEQANTELAALRERARELEAALEKERAAAAQANTRANASEQQLRALQQQVAQLEQSLQQALSQNERLRADREKICSELRRQLASLGQLTQQGGNLVLTLASDILFDFNSYELRPTARENLSKLAVLRLLLFPEAEVRYVGHTDRVGDDVYNQWLSEQRALAVYRYFLEESLSHAPSPALRELAAQRLSSVQQLLETNFANAQRNSAARAALWARLGDTVIGKGEREPVENTEGPSERNRRVVLLFPPAQVGQVTSICEAPAPQP